jgi:DNA replication protein DnaC
VPEIDALDLPSSGLVKDIPKSHWGCHFHTFDFRGNGELKELTRRFVRGDRFWMYLHGKTGTGKTHYAVSLYRAIVAHVGYLGDESVGFTTWGDLCKDLKGSFDDKSYDDRMDGYLGCDALVVDDVTGHLKDYQVRFLEQIVQQRHAEDRRLVVTSNEPFERFLGFFSDHEVSRVRSRCAVVPFTGPDGRLA